MQTDGRFQHAIMHAVYVLDHGGCRSDTLPVILPFNAVSRNGLYGCVQTLQSFYMKLRSEGCTSVTGTTPNLHLLETLIRLAEARARADLRQVYWCHLLTSDQSLLVATIAFHMSGSDLSDKLCSQHLCVAPLLRMQEILKQPLSEYLRLS